MLATRCVLRDADRRAICHRAYRRIALWATNQTSPGPPVDERGELVHARAVLDAARHGQRIRIALVHDE